MDNENLALTNIRFEGADLKHCNFENTRVHKCFFDNADLSHAEFTYATLNDCNFLEANLNGANFSYAKLIHCDFTRATIKEVHLGLTIADQRTTFGEILKSESDGNYNFAAIEYKQLKEMYRNSSLHSEVDKAHYKAMVCKRKTLPSRHPFRWMNYMFGDLLCKYGTSFVNVLIWGIVIIMICAGLFYVNDSLLYQNNDVHISFSDAIYFSMITFSTLGYGDHHAIGDLRFLAAFESLIGLALMSLFTVIVARSIIRD